MKKLRKIYALSVLIILLNCSDTRNLFTRIVQPTTNSKRVQIFDHKEYLKVNIDNINVQNKVIDGIPDLKAINIEDINEEYFYISFASDQELIQEIRSSFDFEITDYDFVRIKLETLQSNSNPNPNFRKVIYFGFAYKTSGRFYRTQSGFQINSEVRVSVQKFKNDSKYSEIAFCQKNIFSNRLPNYFLWQYIVKDSGQCLFFSSQLFRKDNCNEPILDDKFSEMILECDIALKHYQNLYK